MVTEYLIPRLRDPEGPVVVAVVGVSGSGKSTIVNSLARRRISAGGTRRPTTTEPVAWTGSGLPPTLDALRRRLPGRLVDTLRPPPEGIVLVDTPPPGVLDDEGDSVAGQILSVADACLLVAGSSRYADASGIELADRARERGIPTIFVLNRVPVAPELSAILVADYAGKLAGRGLLDRSDPELVVTIAEGPVSEDGGGLPGEWITGVRKELEALADPLARTALVQIGLEHAEARLTVSLSRLRGMLISAETRRISLLDPARIAYGRATTEMLRDVRSGVFAETGADSEAFVAALSAGAARRAGRAARSVAERWEVLASDRLDQEMFGHGPGIPAAARERLEWWSADLPSLAEEVSGRPVRRRKRERLVDAIRRAAVDPRFRPGRKEARILDRHPGAVDAARRRLAEELAGIIHADSMRFLESLGTGSPDGLLAAMTLAGDGE
jgi:energy-coupling factor transporter ATP-binding protein EcfA2